MRSIVSRLLITAAAPIIVGCSKDTVSPMADARVSVQDQCDPASFNAALGSGTCTKQGSMTLTQFNNELNATHQVAATGAESRLFEHRATYGRLNLGRTRLLQYQAVPICSVFPTEAVVGERRAKMSVQSLRHWGSLGDWSCHPLVVAGTLVGLVTLSTVACLMESPVPRS
jgi:hypothetical protein